MTPSRAASTFSRKLTRLALLACVGPLAACDDAASPDRETAGSGAPAPPDTAPPDSGPPEPERPDPGTPDASLAPPDAGAIPPDPNALPETLADTGLFAGGSSGALAPFVMPYAPRYALWSDHADKERWLLLPEGTQIDTSDMDHWQFPVGTKSWKLFARDGKKLETRLLWKTERGWFRIAFGWNDAETEAVALPQGATNVRGTSHDIPERGDCDECHGGTPDRLLGVSAIQLSHDGPGATLATLAASGLLSAPPPAAGYSLPDTTAWNALGYMHANCGHCHNPNSVAYDRLDLDLWLRVAELDAPESTASFTTSVGVELTETMDETLTLRVAPGDADQSGIVQRMQTRGSDRAMPPIASEDVDADGVAAVRAWIDSLP